LQKIQTQIDSSRAKIAKGLELLAECDSEDKPTKEKISLRD
jgi:hypothetical protein